MLLLPALLLLCPVACRGLSASGASEGEWRGHDRLHKLALKPRVDACRPWCRLSRAPWQRKCRWESCGSGCWDCKKNEKADAFNYELVQGRQQLMLAEARQDELRLRQDKEEREEVEMEENFELAKKRAQLVRQRQKELEEEGRRRAVAVAPTFSHLPGPAGFNSSMFAPTAAFLQQSPANFNSSNFAMEEEEALYATPMDEVHDYSTDVSVEPDIQLLDDA